MIGLGKNVWKQKGDVQLGIVRAGAEHHVKMYA